MANQNGKAMVPARAAPPPSKVVRTAYYMEWWRVGDPNTHIQSGTFHTAYLKSFLRMFMGLKKFTVVYLERVRDKKVLWNKRMR